MNKIYSRVIAMMFASVMAKPLSGPVITHDCELSNWFYVYHYVLGDHYFWRQATLKSGVICTDIDPDIVHASMAVSEGYQRSNKLTEHSHTVYAYFPYTAFTRYRYKGVSLQINPVTAILRAETVYPKATGNRFQNKYPDELEDRTLDLANERRQITSVLAHPNYVLNRSRDHNIALYKTIPDPNGKAYPAVIISPDHLGFLRPLIKGDILDITLTPLKKYVVIQTASYVGKSTSQDLVNWQDLTPISKGMINVYIMPLKSYGFFKVSR